MSGARRSACGRPVLVAWLALVAGSCAPPAFERVGLAAGGGDGLRLNEAIVVTFDRPLEPASVTPSSASVRRARDGAPVAGRFRVEGEALRFEPRPPCAADLSDAPFEPGEELLLELVGLPRLIGLRAVDGSALHCGATLPIATRAAPGDWRRAPATELFVDPLPGPPELLSRPARLAGGKITLRFSEPLDPRALAGATFWLHGPWSRSAFPAENPTMVARLLDPTDGAVVELSLAAGATWPMPPAAGMSCDLRFEPREALLDLGGLPLAQNGRLPDLYVRVEVVGD
ncbi:MAG: hypothetical protein JNL90_08560 [Planctomycetes bacterium]|nr:hypothetical protein [Planctomycetota bacterium]